MKKTLFAAIFLGASMLTFNASAQNQKKDSAGAKCPNTECAAGKSDCKGIVPPAGKMKNFNPFIGTTITPEQQAKLDQLNKDRAEKKAAAKEQRQKTKQMNDSVRRAEKLDYLRQVKDIIGPDQYVIFLENIAVAQPQQGKAMRPGKDGAVKSKMDKGDKSKKRSDMKSRDGRDKNNRSDKK